MEIPKLSKADIVVLPLALYGASVGVYKYFIKEPIKQAVGNWIDGHLFDQEEFDRYLGEMALQMEAPPPLS
jgi:hypothetical protein